MRIANGIICGLMLLFAAVQVNDPDGPLWMAIYGAAGFWCGVAAWRPAALGRPMVGGLLALSLFAALAGVVVYWPASGEWWLREVWWDDEGAREGMGMMIVLLALTLAGAAALLRRRRG